MAQKDALTLGPWTKGRCVGGGGGVPHQMPSWLKPMLLLCVSWSPLFHLVSMLRFRAGSLASSPSLTI